MNYAFFVFRVVYVTTYGQLHRHRRLHQRPLRHPPPPRNIPLRPKKNRGREVEDGDKASSEEENEKIIQPNSTMFFCV